MQRALGTAVFSGMLGVTVFGIFFTPVFYAVIQRLRERDQPEVWSARPGPAAPPAGGAGR